MADCPFCAIARDPGAELVARNRQVFVVRDANPKAETHLLVVPWAHVESLDHASSDVVLALLEKARAVGKAASPNGYRVVLNVGEDGKQKVGHLHAHVLAGPEVVEPGFARSVGDEEALDLLELWYGRWRGTVSGTPREMHLRTEKLLAASGRDAVG